MDFHFSFSTSPREEGRWWWRRKKRSINLFNNQGNYFAKKNDEQTQINGNFLSKFFFWRRDQYYKVQLFQERKILLANQIFVKIITFMIIIHILSSSSLFFIHFALCSKWPLMLFILILLRPFLSSFFTLLPTFFSLSACFYCFWITS